MRVTYFLVDVCSTINIDPDIRHFVVEATPDTPCHTWCGCDVTVDDGGSLSVRVLMAELWGVNNCSTSLRLETYDIDDNATSLCSNGSHSMVLPRSGPTMKSVRIVFQRQNCTFDSRFGVDVFGKYASGTTAVQSRLHEQCVGYFECDHVVPHGVACLDTASATY